MSTATTTTAPTANPKGKMKSKLSKVKMRGRKQKKTDSGTNREHPETCRSVGDLAEDSCAESGVEDTNTFVLQDVLGYPERGLAASSGVLELEADFHHVDRLMMVE